MRLSKADCYLMRWSILAVCASTLGSTIILYGSLDYAENAENGRLVAQQMLGDARNRMAATLQDQKNLAIYADEYGALVEQKIIGDDQRLDWMEGLEKIRQKNLVADFRYSIAPQKTYAGLPAIDSAYFDIGYSEMKLQLDLLHAVQLLDFFAALHGDIKGRYRLEGCTLQHMDGPVNTGNPTAGASLRAACSGGWITLKNRDAAR